MDQNACSEISASFTHPWILSFQSFLAIGMCLYASQQSQALDTVNVRSLQLAVLCPSSMIIV